MLISKTAKLRWCGSNKKYYINLGYVFTKINDEFEVKVEHLTKGSHAIVEWECDGENCDEIITGEYRNYLRCVKDDGKIYCNKCANKLFVSYKQRKTKLKNSKSFEQWCIDHDKLDVLSRWDYDKNDCLPSEVSYGSCIPRWFKCDKYPNTHDSELKRIDSFTNGQNGSMDCYQCKSIAQDIINLYGEENLYKIWNEELNGDLSPWDVTIGSDIKAWFNCLDNIHEPYLRSCVGSKISKYRCPECREYPTGENNPNYNPDLTDEDRIKRRQVQGYNEFVKEVLKRDNYTCQITGQYGGKLEVHHLNGYNWDKENRTNIDNGITLCKTIHKLFHKLYGCGDNTAEQFEEFLMKIEYGEINIDNIK